MNQALDKMWTTGRAAKYLGVCSERVRQYIVEGKLPATRFFGRWVVKREDVRNLQRPPLGRPRKES